MGRCRGSNLTSRQDLPHRARPVRIRAGSRRIPYEETKRHRNQQHDQGEGNDGQNEDFDQDRRQRETLPRQAYSEGPDGTRRRPKRRMDSPTDYLELPAAQSGLRHASALSRSDTGNRAETSSTIKEKDNDDQNEDLDQDRR